MTTRYLLFTSEYEGGDNFEREVESLEAAGEQKRESAVVFVVEDGKPAYRLHVGMSKHTAPLEGQGYRQFFDWLDDADNLVMADVFFGDIYRYGEPVPDGYVKRFNGHHNAIMTLAESAEIDAAIERSVERAVGGRMVIYPNGASGFVYRATGMRGVW